MQAVSSAKTDRPSIAVLAPELAFDALSQHTAIECASRLYAGMPSIQAPLTKLRASIPQSRQVVPLSLIVSPSTTVYAAAGVARKRTNKSIPDFIRGGPCHREHC
jgi:hypothetical protein